MSIKNKKRQHKKKAGAKPQPALLRSNRISVNLNDKELRAISEYCQKYKIQNRSKFIRETVIAGIYQKYEQDYPTLF